MNLESLKMKVFFNYLWGVKPRKSEISGERLGSEPLNIYFHHLFEKGEHPSLAFCEDNIILVTAEEHQNLNNNLEYYEKTIERRRIIENRLKEMEKKSERMSKRIEEILTEKNHGISSS